MYAEDIPTWLPPAARRLSDLAGTPICSSNGSPEPARTPSSHSALLELTLTRTRTLTLALTLTLTLTLTNPNPSPNPNQARSSSRSTGTRATG